MRPLADRGNFSHETGLTGPTLVFEMMMSNWIPSGTRHKSHAFELVLPVEIVPNAGHERFGENYGCEGNTSRVVLVLQKNTYHPMVANQISCIRIIGLSHQ